MLGLVKPRGLTKIWIEPKLLRNEPDLWVLWARILKKFFRNFLTFILPSRMTSVKELVILTVGAEYVGQKKSVLH